MFGACRKRPGVDVRPLPGLQDAGYAPLRPSKCEAEVPKRCLGHSEAAELLGALHGLGRRGLLGDVLQKLLWLVRNVSEVSTRSTMYISTTATAIPIRSGS